MDSAAELEELKSYAVEIDEEKRGASYKYGLVTPFLLKFPFEDVEHLPFSYYYGNPDSDSDCDDVSAIWRKYKDPNAHETVKKFLRQVRESNGYEVDCCPPPMFGSPFEPGDPETKDEDYRRDMMRAVHFAIDKINIETGKHYKLVKVERTVTCNYLYLLTFTVKEGDADVDVDASLETLRAMVEVPFYPKGELALLEWMYKPPSQAPESVDPDRMKAKNGESTSSLERLCSADKSAMAHLFSMLDNKSAINLSLSCKSCCYAWASLKKALS